MLDPVVTNNLAAQAKKESRSKKAIITLALQKYFADSRAEETAALRRLFGVGRRA